MTINPIVAAGAIGLALAVGFLISPAVMLDQRGAAALACQAPATAMTRLELIFGTARPSGGPVSEPDWNDFLEAEVTPRFPDGLTVWRGRGQWRDGDGSLGKEDVFILAIWHASKQTSGADVEAVREAYKLRFQQKSVMRIDDVSCVSF